MSLDSKNEDKSYDDFVNSLYQVENISDDELKDWYEAMRYKGFDKAEVLKELQKKVQDTKATQQIILLCGIQGPQRASISKLPNGRTPASYGIPASGLKGSKGVSCQRITAATADLCAYFMKKLNVPKRLNLRCPGWLQFPSAGSITMSEELRALHIEFAQRFSTVIGGVFNEQIYQQMAMNSYINPKLRLFDEIIMIDQPKGPVPSLAPVFDPNAGSVGSTKILASDKSRTPKPKS